MRLSLLKTIPALAALLLATGAARAQDFDDLRLGGAPREGGRFGGVLINGPAYKGSDERRWLLLPVVEYRWANGFFAGVGSGIGYQFHRDETSNAGARITYDGGRRESRADALAGMGNISAKPEIGVYYNQAVATPGFALHASARYGAGGNGLLGELGASYGFALAPMLRLRLGASATFANSAYMQKFFGVSDAQAASTGRYPAYEAKAGVRDTRLSAMLVHVVTPKLALTVGLNADTLHGDAAQSPLTFQRTGVTAMSTLTYGF